MNIEKISQVKDLILPAVKANRFVDVTFRKKDGSLRVMRLHRSRALEDTASPVPSESVEKRKWTLSKNGMMAVEELTPEGAHQFRTVNLGTTVRVAVAGKVHEFPEE